MKIKTHVQYYKLLKYIVDNNFEIETSGKILIISDTNEKFICSSKRKIEHYFINGNSLEFGLSVKSLDIPTMKHLDLSKK